MTLSRTPKYLFTLASCVPVWILAISTALMQHSLLSQEDQDNVDDDTVTLSPFIISEEKDSGYASHQTLVGSRTSKDLLDLPTSVAIINKEMIDDLNAYDVQQVLNVGVSGVSENQSINDDVNIRGFRSLFSLRNGVTKRSFKRSPMYDVERVEVLKGPAAMLLGNNSFLGGAVNLISQIPTETNSGNINVTFGNNSHIRASANVMGPMIKSDGFKMNYRVTLGGLTGDRTKEQQNEDQFFAGVGLAMYVGRNTTVLINAYHFKDDGYYYYEDFLDLNATEFATLNQYSTSDFSPARSKDSYWRNTDQFLDVTWLNKVGENGNFRAYFSAGKLTDERRLVSGNGLAADNYTMARRDLLLTIDENTVNFQFDYVHKLDFKFATLDSIVGLDYLKNPNRQASANNPLGSIDTRDPDFSNDDEHFSMPQPGAGLPFPSDRTSDVTGFSYFFQENMSFWKDRIIAVGGLRWFSPGGDRTNHVTNDVTPLDDIKYRTHKYGVVVKLHPSVSFYYTDAQNTFTQTGFTDKFESGDQLGPPLENQRGQLEEIGVKFNHKVSDNFSFFGSVAHFDMALTNVKTAGVLPDSGEIGNIQSEKDESKGWEADFGFRFNTEGGHADVLATYFNGKSRTAVDPTLPASNFVPVKTTLMAKYTWSSGPLSGFMLGGSLTDQDPKYNRGLYVKYPVLLNLFARYQWGEHWEFQLNMDNLKDERYIVTFSHVSRVMVQEGMQTRFAVKYKW